MSWATHNPEGWTEVCIQGILAKLEEGRGLTQPSREVDEEVLRELSEGVRHYNIFLALMEWASDEVSAVEGAYFDKYAP